MADRILIALSCLLCAGAFFLVGYLCKISAAPVQFWAGSEGKLKSVIKDVPGYNRRMGAIYRWYGLAWLTNAVLGAVSPLAGITGIGVLCTLGLYLLYRMYRKSLSECE